ncbi:restriction endonuclease PLD domain-containing protein [Microcoleus sp. D3_18a_C4]|uniref:restriction endonuclease PLD domain-containing protein n=1 Tax=Microcoleus sp. D3_18a_C4 TaxID=3055332 RepID=UPI002FD2C0FC
MSVIRKFVILEDRQKSLETTIDFLLNCKEYSWDKIYLFSAFVSDDGVKKVKKILEHPYLNENTEVVIAIGTKNYFNKPSEIENLLNFIDKKSMNVKAKSVRFICPTNNFHVKAYCFLGRHVRDNREIGFSIIGSSNLTKVGLECEGELCISIHNLNLTKGLIDRWSNKYNSESHLWNQLRIKEYERQYNKEHSRKDQDEDPEILVKENSTLVNQDQPIPKCKFLKLGVTDDIALIDKGTNLVNGREKIDWFHWSHTTIEQAKVDLPERSLCLLSTENKIFQIGEIMSHRAAKENTEGCFVTYRVNVTYKLSEDIGEILANEKYKIISNPEHMEELPYDTLKDFEEEVNKYQKMLNDPNYQTGLKKGEKKMQKMQSEIDRILELEIDPSLMKEQIKKILHSI